MGYFVFVIIFAILAIIFGPLAIIWALNVLFPVLAIPFSLKTWFAIVVLNLTWMSKGIYWKKAD